MKPISSKLYIVFSIIVLLFFLGLGVAFEIALYVARPEMHIPILTTFLVFIFFTILYLPLGLVLKASTEGYTQLPFKQLLFAGPKGKTVSEQFEDFNKKTAGLGQFFDEPKRDDTADLWRRILAYFIDMAVVIGIIMLGVGIIVIFRLDDSTVGFPVAMIVITVVSVFYLFGRDGFSGAGLGKRVVGIKVINISTGKPIGFLKSSLRYLILRLLGLVELVLMVVQSNHRRLGDYLAKTIVVQHR